MYNSKNAVFSFYVSDVQQSVLGVDGIFLLNLVISYNNDSIPSSNGFHVAKCDRVAQIRLVPDAPSIIGVDYLYYIPRATKNDS